MLGKLDPDVVDAWFSLDLAALIGRNTQFFSSWEGSFSPPVLKEHLRGYPCTSEEYPLSVFQYETSPGGQAFFEGHFFPPFIKNFGASSQSSQAVSNFSCSPQ